MRKRTKIAFLSAFAPFFLVSCGKTDEVYPDGQYELGSFEDYFFVGHDEVGTKKGTQRKSVALSSEDYWNGTNNGRGSVSFTPLAYKVTPTKEGDAKEGYTLLVDWDVYDLHNEATDGYIWYWSDYSIQLTYRIEKDGENVTRDFQKSFFSSNVSTVAWNGDILSIKSPGESELTLTFISGDLSLISEANVSVKAPYGDRKGFSDEETDLFKGEVEGKEVTLSLSSVFDWTSAYRNMSDEEFFKEHPSFGKYYSLGRVDPSFRKGYLSKLYNGQIYCDGYHSLAFVCLENNGFTQIYDKEIDVGDAFLMSFRGGSDFVGGKGHDRNEPRISSFDLSIDFYYKSGSQYDFVSVNAEDVITETDHGGEGTTMFGFRFEDVGIDPSGIVGIGIHYDGFEDRYSSVTGLIDSHRPNEKEYQFGLLLYEVMFPGATWR